MDRGSALNDPAWVDLTSTPGRPADHKAGGGRRVRPGGRHCEQRLGKGPVGHLAAQRPATPSRGGIKRRAACPNCRRQRLATMVI